MLSSWLELYSTSCTPRNDGKFAGSRDCALAIDRGLLALPLDGFATALAGAAIALRRFPGPLAASTPTALGGLSEDPDVPKPLRDRLVTGMDSGDSPVASIAPRTRGGAYYLLSPLTPKGGLTTRSPETTADNL